MERAQLTSSLTPILATIGLLIYFAVLCHFTFPAGAAPLAIRYAIMPAVFTFPWALFLFIFRERTYNAWNAMKEKTSIIPLRWRMFYGFNTLVVLAFFILPFLSPPLAVFAALVLTWRIVYHSEFIWQRGPGIRFLYGAGIFCLLAAIPIILFISWVNYYLGFFVQAIFPAWLLLINPIYNISICIVDALAVGALLHLSYGTLTPSGDFRRDKAHTIWTIRLIEGLIAGVLLFITFDPLGLRIGGLITYVNWACLVLVALVFIAKLCIGIRGQTQLSTFGILLAVAFLLVEIFMTFNYLLKGALIVISSLFFIVAFLVSFAAAPDQLELEYEEPTSEGEDQKSEED